jgi:small subunit ribosomal protein S13
MSQLYTKTGDKSCNITNSLYTIYGINKYLSQKICNYMGINPKIRTTLLKKTQIHKLKNYIEKNIIIGHDLKKKLKDNYKNLLNIKTYRGLRHSLGLPVNGQRTHTNAKTKKRLKSKYVW